MNRSDLCVSGWTFVFANCIFHFDSYYLVVDHILIDCFSLVVNQSETVQSSIFV